MNNYVIYKPNSSKTGSALSFDFNKLKKSVFLEFAKQKEEKAFDWQNKQIFKLSAQDCSKICVLIRDRKEELNLFHDPNKSINETTVKNAVLKITKTNFGYSFKINQQEKDNTINSIAISVTEDEAYILVLIFNKAIESIYLD
ncbi:MAG: hypothetical protein COT14_03170 [Candidatus Diapherotrites archaeon CG08_land_8_20_14_0_20_30_16]|nr:MAG: hypothetical protein COT14_03170 [Candidatus Diapherotrites archaeon CG08_land_8_20_14_0_20_30_16]